MSRHQIAIATFTVMLAVVFTGCREGEQGRPLSFEQGTYQGEKPPPLTRDQVRALQERGNLMR